MTAGTSPVVDRGRAWVVLGLMAIVWGVHWTILKFALGEVPPFTYAALRIVVGGVAIAAGLAAAGRLHRPARADLPIVLTYGLVGIAATVAFANLGLARITAGHASILAYTLPLWVVPIMAIVRRTLPTPPEWAGLLLGMVGLALLLQPGEIDWGATGAIVGAIFLLLNAVSGAVAMVHVRLHRWTGAPVEVQPWQFLVALVPLVLLAVPEASTPIDWSPSLLLAVLYSGLLATAFGYWAQQTAVRSLGPMATGVGSLSVPVIGVTVGAIVLGERVTPTEVLGLVITMAGVLVVLFGSRAAGRVRARRSPAP